MYFICSPDDIETKRIILFNKFMNQRCGELEKTDSEIIEGSKDDMKNKLQRDLVEVYNLNEI